jgi:hypothetical protein
MPKIIKLINFLVLAISVSFFIKIKVGKSAKSNGLGDVCKGFRVSVVTFTFPRATCCLFKGHSAILTKLYTPSQQTCLRLIQGDC